MGLKRSQFISNACDDPPVGWFVGLRCWSPPLWPISFIRRRRELAEEFHPQKRCLPDNGFSLVENSKIHSNKKQIKRFTVTYRERSVPSFRKLCLSKGLAKGGGLVDTHTGQWQSCGRNRKWCRCGGPLGLFIFCWWRKHFLPSKISKTRSWERHWTWW